MFKKPFIPVKNPYIVGNPIKSEEMFFGREEDFKIIQNWIVYDGPHVILLMGGRRSGKTSILWQIFRGRLKSAGEAVLCDFHALVPRIQTDEDFPKEVGKAILDHPIFKKFEPQFLPDDGSSWTVRLQKLVENCLEEIKPRKLMVLCDEFEAIEELFKTSLLSSRALLWVKHLLNLPIYFVMTGSHEFKESNVRSVFGAVTQQKPIYELSMSDALALIQKPIGNQITFKNDVLQVIYRLSGGHPFYTQYICHTLINHINAELKRNYVITKDLEEVTDFIVHNPAGHIQETWKGLANPRMDASGNTQAALAALANTVKKSNEYASLENILKTVEKRRFRIERQGLYEALAWLKHNTRLLEWQDENYRFRIDLIRHWIANNFQTGEDIELVAIPIPPEGMSFNPPSLAPGTGSVANNESVEENFKPATTTRVASREGGPAESASPLREPEAPAIAPEIISVSASQEYVEELRIFLQNGIITLAERKSLDNLLIQRSLNQSEADLLEDQVRTELQVRPRDWLDEYKESCHVVRTQHPRGIPHKVLKNLNDTYVGNGRISLEQAKEVSKYLGLRPAWGTSLIASMVPRGIYWWGGMGVALAGVGMVAVIWLKPSPPTSVPDQVEPSGYLVEIKDSYLQGEDLVGWIGAGDNELLQRVTFAIPNRNVQETWEVANDSSFTKQLSFSTQGWPVNQQYAYLLTIVDKAGNSFKVAGEFRLTEPPPKITASIQENSPAVPARIEPVTVATPPTNPLPAPDQVQPGGYLVGIKDSYLQGEELIGWIGAGDNELLQRVTFAIPNRSVQEIWEVANKDFFTKPLSVSTQGWPVDQQYAYLLTIVDKSGNSFKVEGHFELTESPPKVKVTGLKQDYVLGETVFGTLEVVDRNAVKTITFTVNNTSSVIWNGKATRQRFSFSTRGWQAGAYTYSLSITSQLGNSFKENGSFTLVEKVIPTVPLRRKTPDGPPKKEMPQKKPITEPKPVQPKPIIPQPKPVPKPAPKPKPRPDAKPKLPSRPRIVPPPPPPPPYQPSSPPSKCVLEPWRPGCN